MSLKPWQKTLIWGSAGTAGLYLIWRRTPQDKVVAAALEFIRTPTPYQRGGEEPGVGADCSGLVKTAYAAIGIDLPHKAAYIRQLGREVPVDSLRRGDIPYVNNTGAGVDDHVGIYDGRGNVIHATSVYGSAVIQPITEWVKKGWLHGARRLIG